MNVRKSDDFIADVERQFHRTGLGRGMEVGFQVVTLSGGR
jgi:hypothetical protein